MLEFGWVLSRKNIFGWKISEMENKDNICRNPNDNKTEKTDRELVVDLVLEEVWITKIEQNE